MSEGRTRALVLIALILAAPWPWYLFAVGGLLPVPVILVWAMSGPPVVSVMLLLCAASGVLVFYLAARAIARRIKNAYALAAVLGAIALVSLLPIYGGGENLASPAGKFQNLYRAYSSNLGFI